ncbi:soluble methane monooxygenase-binding protein MmoD [Methylomonas sp. MgM2]
MHGVRFIVVAIVGYMPECSGDGLNRFLNHQTELFNMMDFFSNFKSSNPPVFPEDNDGLTKLYDGEPYTAFCEDLEFMWRWTIYRDKKLVQEGCSLTEDASRRAVEHVMAFFNVANGKQPQGE